MMSSMPSLSQSMKPTPPLTDSRMYRFSGVELWGTVRPAILLISSKCGTGKAGSVPCARHETARTSSARTVQIEPMRFVYSSKMCKRVRPVVSCVLLIFGGLLTVGAAQKTAGKPAEKLPVATTVHFSDITAAAGITFQHTVSPEKKYLIESMPGGVLLLDYDGDGWLDIYFTNSPSVGIAVQGQKAKSALYRNNHDGTFTDVTEKAGVGYPCWAMGGAVGDYNNDGWTDMLITCEEGMVLYRNNGDGTFTDVSQAAGVDDASGYYGLGVVWSDFNDDGRPDLFVADDSTPNYLYRNDGKGHFTDVSYISGTAVGTDGGEMAGMGIAICDFNHTGRFSIHVTNFEDQSNSLYRNDGNLAFTDVAFAAGVGQITIPYLGWGTGCVDLDNDGWPDLFVVNGHVYPQVDSLAAGAKYRQRKLVFLNRQNGTFADISNSVGPAVTIPQPSRGAAFGDLDNDGRIDVVVENIDGLPMVLHNETTISNHWITFQLVGTRSNRLALGAKVRVVAGSLSQIDEVRSGGSYLSQNDLRLHFGLGPADKVDRVEVRWPSGSTQTLQNLASDRFYIVKEGEGIVTSDRVRPDRAKANPAVAGQR